MQVTINWQTILTAAAVLGAVIALYKYFSQMVRWMDRQKIQDEEIKQIKEENQLHTYALLACLKGLAEQGCDGPVHSGIEKIEEYLNKHAHNS